MVIIMKISWIKQENDNKNFNIVERLGMNVCKLQNPEDIDRTMEKLINQNYNTLVLSNELASFSQDIIKKYSNSEDIKIIISSRKI